MNEKKIIVDGEIIYIGDKKIDENETGVFVPREKIFQDTMKINTEKIKESINDTIYNIGDISE